MSQSPIPQNFRSNFKFSLVDFFDIKLLEADFKYLSFFAEISYQFLDAPKRTIYLSLEGNGLEEYKEHLPFAYQIMEQTSEPNIAIKFNQVDKTYIFDTYAVIRIVAGPGTRIKTINFQGTVDSTLPKLEIYQVQDPDLVPPQGFPINPAYYLGMQYIPEDYWDIFSNSNKISIDGPPPLIIDDNPIQIDPRSGKYRAVWFTKGQSTFIIDVKIQPPIVMALPDGIYIKDVNTNSHILITVPIQGDKSGNARFYYRIFYDGRNSTEIHIVKTQEVSINYLTNYRTAIVDPSGVIEEVEKKIIVLVDNINSYLFVPNQGDLYVVDGSKQIKPVVHPPSWVEPSLDILFGLIPVVGDCIDLAELLSGYDKWGNKLTVLERAIVGVGLLLPFVSGSTLSKTKKIFN